MTKIQQSEKRKAYWAKIPKNVRSARMSAIVKKRWSQKTEKERSEYGRMMAIARIYKNQRAR